jgi:hypothetical protein
MYLYNSLRSLKKDNISKNRVINGGQERVLKKSPTPANIVVEGIGIEEEFKSRWYQEKTKGS